DSVFQLLFKYRPVMFQQGEFRLVPSTGSYVAAVLVVAAIAATVLTYRSARVRGASVKHRLVLTALRVATLGLMLFCLFRPLMKSLSDKFIVRTFRFSSVARRLGNPQELTFTGSQTRLGSALEGARQEL